MAIIWGLDLRDMQWGKFKGAYMFNHVYHLRKTKMIVYQIAMILCVCSESVGTAALSDYVDQRDGIKSRYGYHTSVRDIVGIFSFNIFVGIAVATIFGSGFFFDLFWPQRHESIAVKKAWKICSVLMCFLTFADAIALTVIVATQRATIDGLTNSEAQQYFDSNGPPNPIYRKNAYCVASVVLLWLGMLGTIASTYIMWKSLAHDKVHGPFASNFGPKDEPWQIHTKSAAIDTNSPSMAESGIAEQPIAAANTPAVAQPTHGHQTVHHTT
ncbi:hypothetical protein BELL_0037g00020 [Botrytis elliptica]|uniref:MARVEL domain-containing protein n=1 Tax=Botrytis elliptica TaxID=278938 RepID=A0A4Z1K0J8_9HELO|nr:hypothetical protein EAE99_004677 [Botrytis elliptica]TGO79288.1 hypothetical protein BELL_0037g00020 [Botrytis elliptica]